MGKAAGLTESMEEYLRLVYELGLDGEEASRRTHDKPPDQFPTKVAESHRRRRIVPHPTTETMKQYTQSDNIFRYI